MMNKKRLLAKIERRLRDIADELGTEPTITPAMIEAGVAALYDVDDSTFAALSSISVERIAVAVFEAMDAAARHGKVQP